LADESGVSEKTIRRDLATLRSVGFPIEEETGEFGRKSYRIDPRRSKPEIGFTFDEALALYLGRKFLRPFAGTMIWEAAQRAFKKIRATLGESALKYIENAGSAFHETAFGVSDYSGRSEILDNLLIGIEDRMVVFITYRSQRATEPVTYPIHPYCFKRHEGSVYVHGHKPDDGELRTWKLDRIEQADVDTMPFTVPAGLDLEARFAGSLGIYDGQDDVHVKIRFAPAVARYISEKQWHPSQQLASQKDGSLIVELRLSNTVEVKSWVLSFGANAQVLEPDELHREIADDLTQTLSLYSTPQPERAES